MLGESGVGKTSLVQRFVFDLYHDPPHATRNEESKIVSFKNGLQIQLNIIDTAGM